MSVTSATLFTDKNLVLGDGIIMLAGEHEGIHIPERPDANAPDGKQPAQWLFVTADSTHVDVTALVESGDIALLV